MRARSLLNPNPAYVWRPRQIGRRLAASRRGPGRELVVLPWGDEIVVDPGESVGSGIARLGVHELRVSEAMWRLTERSDLALDVGANIGYYTSLLGRRAGRVIAFEPHPVLLARLRANVARWPGPIEVEGRAASSASGQAELGEPEAFAANTGTAGLGLAGARSFTVETVALDEVVDAAAVGVLKIDVEGHELAALDGFDTALREGRVRDVFFEEHEPLPTPVSSRLAGHGYTLFALRQRLDRVTLAPPERLQRSDWDAPTYLATRDPERARRLVRGFGWSCLRGRGGEAA